MRHLLRLFFLLTAFAGLSVPSYAQVSGIQGKRFIAKANLATAALDRGFSFEAEYAIGRLVTVGVGYHQTDKNLYYTRFSGLFGSTSHTGAKLKTDGIFLNAKYFISKGFPAPRGSYLYAQVLRGKASIILPAEDYIEEEQNIRKNFTAFEVGYGEQMIIKRRYVIDIGMGYTHRPLKIDDYRWTSLRSNGNVWSGVRSGYSAHVKIGMLLF